MSKKIFFIGVDSGGTKSEVLISSAGGRKISGRKFSSVHYSVHGAEKTAHHLKKIILDSLKTKKLSAADCGGICIGLAGAREKNDRDRIAKKLGGLLRFKKILIETDSMIALHGAFNGEDGMILICGTGSILYGLSKGRFFRVGGWGRIIGDHGSGYEIGRAAIRHLVREYDHEKKPGKLSQAIEKKFSFSPDNIINHIYHKNFDVQSAVPVVLRLAALKDRDALKIIDSAVEDLLRHVAIKLKGSKSKFRLALSGSIIENENILSRRLKARVKKEFGSRIKIINKPHTPSEGAVLLAKNKFGIN